MKYIKKNITVVGTNERV